MPRKEDEIAVRIEIKIGQAVFVADIKYITGDKPCPDCEGTGVWKLTTPLFECSTPCGTCSTGYYFDGSGRLPAGETIPFPWEGTVGQIEEVTTKDGKDVRVMLVQTGVGSGTCWDVDRLYGTMEEAQAASLLLVAKDVQRRKDNEIRLRGRKVRHMIHDHHRLSRIRDHLESDHTDAKKLALIKKIIAGRNL